MKQNKKPKQTLESAQYGLEINFNFVIQQAKARGEREKDKIFHPLTHFFLGWFKCNLLGIDFMRELIRVS